MRTNGARPVRTRGTRRWLAAGVALHLLLVAGTALAATTGGAGTTGRSGDAATSSMRPGGPPEDPWSDVQAVDDYAREHLADTFGGLYVEDSGSSKAVTVVVNVTRPPSGEQERAMRALLKNGSLRIQQVQHSLAELEQTQNQITEAMADLSRQGVDIAWAGVDVMANRVTVAVTGSPAAAEQVLRQRFAGDMLQVIQGERPVPLVRADGPDGGGNPGGEASVQIEVQQATDAAGSSPDAESPKPSFWQRLLNLLKAWWNALFG